MTKKIISITIVLLLIFCVACGTKELSNTLTCDEILTVAMGECQQPQNTMKNTKDNNPLDLYTMSLWADGAYQECEEFELLDDYALYYSSDNTTFEISVLKTKSKSDAQKMSAVLERRRQTLSAGDKAEYDPNFERLINESKIITDGNFVLLLITDNNNDIVDAINKLK